MKKTVEVLDNVTGAPRMVRSQLDPINPGDRPVLDAVLSVGAAEKLWQALLKVTAIEESTLRVHALGLDPAAGWTMPPASESEGWYGLLIVEGDEQPTYAVAVSSPESGVTESEPDLQIPLRRDRLFLIDIDRKIEVLPFLPLAGTGAEPAVLTFHLHASKTEEVS